jgi:bidirectional [NiFe] hydrogenase diaphorase subunit
VQSYLAKASPPSDDKRWRIVEGTMRRNGHQSHALIETLHTVQESFGFLDEEGLRYVAVALRVPLSKVYGVATFYHFFSLKPPGRHRCVVCTGTACYIKGAGELIEAVTRAAEIAPGETSRDGEVSLLTARCLGSCGLAPAVVFDGEVAGKVSAVEVAERVRRWMGDDA